MHGAVVDWHCDVAGRRTSRPVESVADWQDARPAGIERTSIAVLLRAPIAHPPRQSSGRLLPTQAATPAPAA
ncbi:hypothetical protein XFF6992_370094 [Xanthomonas citri pv. fuscans]|nr:hypothetical protein XFF6992_370094 [Xanthomonas citri pv. fuscans]SOO33792.1 hypothetical protein XFF6994_3170006 [Xanthomonas citri pv. fuscans]